VAAHIGVQDGLDLELCRLHRDNATDPIARAILDRLVADKTRHAAFGWFYLETRASGWGDSERCTIVAEVEHVIRDIEFAGFRCVWLCPSATDIAEADRITRAAGLGAATRAEEEPVLRRYLTDAAAQLAKLGIVAAI